MKFAALLTSAGINIGICVLLLSLYSILRKQPGNASVYFGRRLAEERSRRMGSFVLERFVPSPSWIVKAWSYSEEEILSIAGLDAVVFIRIIVFSMRIFSIAAIVCMFGVLPLNYFGQEMEHGSISSESLDVFTIGNVKMHSHWLWVHCLALYIISCSACALLYFEYKSIARLRLLHITRSPPNPSHFTVLVRAIPKSKEETFNDSVKHFFTNHHASSYLSHQIICRVGKVHKVMNNAELAIKKLNQLKDSVIVKTFQPLRYRCGLCGGASNSFRLYHNEFELSSKKTDATVCSDSTAKHKECAAAFVFFRTRYAAVVTSEILQSSNPMYWVTDLAPEPHDVYWSNLWIPYRQLWFRKIATLIASIVFMILFLIPVTFVQGLSQLDHLRQTFPFLNGILRKSNWKIMLCCLLVDDVGKNFIGCNEINQLNVISSPKDIPTQLAIAVPSQATFFITYVLTSGWASLSSEIMQLFGLVWNFIRRRILRWKDDPISVPSFPYHTEVPKVLLFGLLGFTCSILAPLILPFLLIYFFLSYVVYRNQIVHVYCSKYESGGKMWPIAHNTIIFSLVLSQIIAIGVFGIKKSPTASSFTIPLVICTLLFNEYCRQRFSPIFKKFSAEDLMQMDKEDELSGKMEEILEQLPSAYCQFPDDTQELDIEVFQGENAAAVQVDGESSSNDAKCGFFHRNVFGFLACRLKQAVMSLTFMVLTSDRTSQTLVIV
ncbi:hypothetical protein HPP92_017160 [Vanilla planifolia]|uniref:CSC1-like protein RXW8 n=1 Tax=Vanilla planifolia TaxID=51239 RepID=A0A835QHI3_VANPL|nr:hypothetical protein HPP92_017160 [Vanilla planifolia]